MLNAKIKYKFYHISLISSKNRNRVKMMFSSFGGIRVVQKFPVAITNPDASVGIPILKNQ